MTGVGASTRRADRPVRLSVLTRFELTCSGQVVHLPPGGERVLAYLAVRGPSERRGALAHQLWADTSESRASANLRTVLWKISQCGVDPIRVTRTHVELGLHVHTDLADLLERARRLISADPVVDDDLRVGSLAHDLLVTWDQEWLMFEREHLRQLRLHALEALANRLTGLGRYGEAVEAALTAVAAAPLRESAQRALIVAHVAEGNLSEALRQYDAYRTLLDSELGIAPTHEMQAVVDGLGTLGPRVVAS